MLDEEFGDSSALHLSFPSQFSTIFSDHHHQQILQSGGHSFSTNGFRGRTLLSHVLLDACSVADHEPEIPNGWPLGLEVMNMRLRVVDGLQASAVEQQSMHMPSTSFSSFSSSNLDTESTASFFQDNSVPLGRLIGIRTGDGSGGLYIPNRMRFNEHERGDHPSELSRGHSMEMSHGICIPLLFGILVKMSRSKSSSKH